MGLVCAALLAQQPHVGRVKLWGHEPSAIERLAQSRVSPRLTALRLPDRVAMSSDAKAVLAGANIVVSAVPTQFARPVWNDLAQFVPAGCDFVSVAKGIETGTLLTPIGVLRDVVGSGAGATPRSFAVLSGPTIAAELARCLPATMIAASADRELATLVQRLFSTQWLRVYTSDDPVGVEVAGATKNVIAIAAGILDGLRAGYNAKSALLARGLAEITRLGVAMGARPDTFFGLAGAGDLTTTCFSPEGRNRSLGEALGRGMPLSQALAGTESVVEGVATTASVLELSRRLGVEMPITQGVHAVLYEGLDPLEAIQRLMTRELKAERIG